MHFELSVKGGLYVGGAPKMQEEVEEEDEELRSPEEAGVNKMSIRRTS